jgi:transcriptional regulator with XRE-family HTH domain
MKHLHPSLADANLHFVQKQPVENRLRQLRESRNLKLYDVSALVRADPATVHRWETGATQTVPDETKITLSRFYNVTVEYLMGWDNALDKCDPGDPEAEAA